MPLFNNRFDSEPSSVTQTRSIEALSRTIGIIVLVGFLTIAGIGGYLLTINRSLEPTDEATLDQEDIPSREDEQIELPSIPREPKEFRVLAVSKLEFRPDIMQIRVGDTVIWENPDAEVHTASAANFTAGGEPFFNELLEPGKSFRFTFTEPGTYFYSCSIKYHGMQGIIRVQE